MMTVFGKKTNVMIQISRIDTSNAEPKFYVGEIIPYPLFKPQTPEEIEAVGKDLVDLVAVNFKF